MGDQISVTVLNDIAGHIGGQETCPPARRLFFEAKTMEVRPWISVKNAGILPSNLGPVCLPWILMYNYPDH
jgi:hypothetical protein